MADFQDITGIKIAAEPVLEDNSVRKTINAIQEIIIIHGVEIELINTVASHNEVPVFPNTTDKHKPPPNSKRIPQPILFSRSCLLYTSDAADE